MALKALDIYKFLPKTNCAKCGSNTCLAFAMQLAAKKADLEDCPDITEEAKLSLEGASSPPIRLITIGDSSPVQIGNETVLFRHDETFYHPTAVAVRVRDTLDEQALGAALEAAKNLSFERVGQQIAVDMIAVENASGNRDAFVQAVTAASKTGLAMILMSQSTEALAAALVVCSSQKPLLYRADESNWEAMAKLAVEFSCPLCVNACDLDAAADLTQKLIGKGAEDLVLDVSSDSMSSTLQALTRVRRLALKKGCRPLGYPCLAIPASDEADMASLEAASYLAKYAGIVVVDTMDPWRILPILTVRQNVFTDPRKPVQVEPKVYSIGAVSDDSPFLITTNFSLTYYTVEGDIEASRVPCYVGVIETEGTSVLTAWASEKLTVDKVVQLLNSDEVTSRLSHRKVIIPGYVAVMSGKLEDESGWQVMVGPRESSGIPKYLKTMWKSD